MTVASLFADFRDYLSLRAEHEVRDFLEDLDWSMNQRNLAPKTVPGARHVAAAADNANGGEERLLRSLLANLDAVHWLQSYTADDFGQGFIDNYGFVEMFGTRGHFDCTTLAGGFFLQGPNQHYPAHYHVAEEIYIPLTGGSYWMRDVGPFVERKAGELILHDSNEPHAMETPAIPLVAIYVWRGGDLAQKSEF